ncbi:hypothetical protein CEXT_123901 [Caerostris extrusa]|uniref:Uncharacterized protein n=1 Tax=Caerostris extrusa TaxID=172846 RepID=A0AAV4XTY9_CAEEX|nr:hypothetical protein CEXT_123901 [Caerostris extrusa]
MHHCLSERRRVGGVGPWKWKTAKFLLLEHEPWEGFISLISGRLRIPTTVPSSLGLALVADVIEADRPRGDRPHSVRWICGPTFHCESVVRESQILLESSFFFLNQTCGS